MSKILQVKLKTTLKGERLFPYGSVFTGPLEELPNDVAKAVEVDASYIEVRELAPAETSGAAPQAKPAAAATKKADEGASTSAKKKPSPRKTTTRKPRTRKLSTKE